jgi:hypothetical protein
MKGMLNVAEQTVDVFTRNDQASPLGLVQLARLPRPSRLWL